MRTPPPRRPRARAARIAAAVAGLGCGPLLGYGASVARVQLQARIFPRHWQRLTAAPAGADPAGRQPITMTVLGDSAASGVGANDPQAGYVGILSRRLAEVAVRPVQVTNISVPGASSWLLMEEQLSIFRELQRADVVMCVIGANDIADRKFTIDGFAWTAERLYPQLPPGTVVSTIPSFGLPWLERREKQANELIIALARRYDLELANLYGLTRRLWPFEYLRGQGGDFFHPNERGYRVWADALWPAFLRAYQRSLDLRE